MVHFVYNKKGCQLLVQGKNKKSDLRSLPHGFSLSHLAARQWKIMVAGNKGSKVKEERESNTNIETAVDKGKSTGSVSGVKGQLKKTYLNSLLDPLRWARVVFGVQVCQEEGIDKRGFAQSRLT